MANSILETYVFSSYHSEKGDLVSTTTINVERIKNLRACEQ